MKTLIATLTNTYKAVRLLSNPDVGAYLQEHITKKTHKPTPTTPTQTFGTGDAYYHKHYIVQVIH